MKALWESGSARTALDQRVEGRFGTRALVCMQEPLDLYGATRLLQRAEPLRRNCQALVVDLQKADFIDSSGVRALLALAEELEAEGKTLHVVIQPDSQVERTLDLLKLRERLSAHPNLESAWPTYLSPN